MYLQIPVTNFGNVLNIFCHIYTVSDLVVIFAYLTIHSFCQWCNLTCACVGKQTFHYTTQLRYEYLFTPWRSINIYQIQNVELPYWFLHYNIHMRLFKTRLGRHSVVGSVHQIVYFNRYLKYNMQFYRTIIILIPNWSILKDFKNVFLKSCCILHNNYKNCDKINVLIKKLPNTQYPH